MSDQFLGEIRMVGFNFAPLGWATCDGQLLSITQNAALFSLLGTTYGGDGVQTFALPNLQNSAALHFGQGPGLSNYNEGDTGGAATVPLLTSQLPAHTHAPVQAVSGVANQASPANNLWAANAFRNYASSSNSTMNAAASGTAGGNLPHNNMPPYLGLLFVIALVGIFPREVSAGGHNPDEPEA